MGAPILRAEASDCTKPRSHGFIDYILHRKAQDGFSFPGLAGRTGIKKSRLHSILHPDCEKRRPITIDEYHALIDALDLSQTEASIASELFSRPVETPHGVDIMVKIISSVVAGLATGLPEMVEHVEGLDWSDIRPDHGGYIGDRVLKELYGNYEKLLDRRAEIFKRTNGL